MKKNFLFLALCFFAGLSLLPAKSPEAASFSSPESLVSDLYQQSDKGHSPFFQTKQRGLLDRYFTLPLAALIWKEAVSSKGEVGALDFNPLYEAQDWQIRKLSFYSTSPNPPQGKGDTEVIASFDNMGHKKKVIYSLISTKTGWKISNITYRDGRTLVGILIGK